MIKHFCDRCGGEMSHAAVNPSVPTSARDDYGEGVKPQEWCGTCLGSFVRWLTNGPQERRELLGLGDSR